jgi:4,5-DOPA dioxygenase extradiol
LHENERTRRLLDWESADFARYCHPREEHLLPLHVCYGMAQCAAERVFEEDVMGKKACAFLWDQGS